MTTPRPTKPTSKFSDTAADAFADSRVTLRGDSDFRVASWGQDISQ